MNDSNAGHRNVQLDGIGQIAITVSDLARSKEFYRDTLGLKFLFDAGSMCFFQCGNIRLMIGASDKPVAAGGVILYYRVENLDETHEVLSARGVAFTQKPHLVAKMPDHDLWMAFLADPDGHPIGLMCEVGRTSM